MTQSYVTIIGAHFLYLLSVMYDLRFYAIFNNISVISGQWAGDNENLCAMEPRLRLKSSPPQAGLEPGPGLFDQ